MKTFIALLTLVLFMLQPLQASDQVLSGDHEEAILILDDMSVTMKLVLVHLDEKRSSKHIEKVKRGAEDLKSRSDLFSLLLTEAPISDYRIEVQFKALTFKQQTFFRTFYDDPETSTDKYLLTQMNALKELTRELRKALGLNVQISDIRYRIL